MNELHRRLLDVAIDAAVEGGRITLSYFQSRAFQVEAKEDSSPVTVADRGAEERIRAIIRSAFPEHSILGEEFGESGGSVPVRWIVDPLDGTKTFIAGVPFYGTLIGVEIDGALEVGVAHFPALGETYYAALGSGAFWNGRRIRVSETSALSDATLLATDIRRLERDQEKSPGWRRLLDSTKMFRTWGDCYGHMLVASGRAEIMLDPKMSPWDSAPLKIIMEEAGGIFTDWSGARTIHGGSAVSTNKALHDAVMEMLHQMPVSHADRPAAADLQNVTPKTS